MRKLSQGFISNLGVRSVRVFSDEECLTLLGFWVSISIFAVDLVKKILMQINLRTVRFFLYTVFSAY